MPQARLQKSPQARLQKSPQVNWRDKTWAEILQHVKSKNDEKAKRHKAAMARTMAAARAGGSQLVTKYEYSPPGLRELRWQWEDLLELHGRLPLPGHGDEWNGDEVWYVVPDNPAYTKAALALLIKGLQQKSAQYIPKTASALAAEAQYYIPRSFLTRFLQGSTRKPLTARQLAARNSAILARRRRRRAVSVRK